MKDPIGILVALAMLGMGVMCAFFTERCYKRVSPEQMELDRKRFKRLGFVLLPVGLLLLVYYIAGGGLDLRRMAGQSPARRVIRECMAATETLDKSRAGFARADGFIRRIRAIDTDGAPGDLVQALHEHVDALERSLKAASEGKDTRQLDEQVVAAKERFATAVRKYW